MVKYLGLVAVVFITACSSDVKQKTAEDTVSADSILQKEEIKADSSSISFLLKASAAGDFSIGQDVKTFKKETYTMILKNDTINTEEGDEIVPVYYVMDGQDIMMKLKIQNNDAAETVYDISVLSPKYKTEKGTNVGQSLTNFRDSYPDAKAYFTYVSGMFWLQTETIPGMQFLLDGENYTGKEKLDDQDMKELDLNKFKPGTKIREIRIWD